MADSSRRSNWNRVSSNHPCPVCKHADWCAVTADGTLAKCMRVEAGAFKSGQQRDGTPFYLHRLDGTAGPASTGPDPRPPARGSPRADADLLHRAYSALLGGLRLSKAHREALNRRGLTDAEIEGRGYRTLPVRDRDRLAGELRQRENLGDALLTVPGFIRKPGKDGTPYLTIAGAAGLLVPVRDAAGRIVALLSRRDTPGAGGGKYTYLSSAKYNGPSPGAPPHVPLGTAAPAETVRLTEGALKADAAAALSGLPTIGAAGLAWLPALDVARELGCKTVRLAFDADAWDNPNVARALAACFEAVAAAGLAVEMERWDKADGKGIDDLLAAGKKPELLTGRAVRVAINEALAASTAGEPPPPPDELDRLDAVLADGGARALFADRQLLDALAGLAETDPAGYAARCAALKGHGVSLRELNTVLAPLRRDLARERPPVLLAAAGYRIAAGCIVRRRDTLHGPVEEPLCNFTARIVEALTRDDGAERSACFTVAGALADGRELPAVPVPAADFDGMGWITTAWHGEAVVFAGQGTRDHLRAAILSLSPNRARRTVYGHAGWRKIGDTWHYLHAGGAIGADGLAAGVEVALPEPLALFVLPDPPEGAALSTAVRASLALLDGLAPDRIMFPLLGAVYRAALGGAPGPIDLSLFLAGPHGAGKSELAALAQQHYGAGLDARHLPGSWLSTANSLEALAFAAMDALFVIDDYAPRGAAGDRQRLEAAADRLLRGAANQAGRGRMNRDCSLRPVKYPRGLILSTGEDVPPGQSLRGRMLVLEVSPGDVPLAGLTPHQQAAAAGRYAEALAGYVRWLAPQYGELCDRLPGERADLRDKALTDAASARTPGIVADLALGLKLFLDFALAVGALDAGGRDALARRGWHALRDAARAHGGHVEEAEPTGHFLRLLAAALASGRAHVAGPDGTAPASPEAWGWRRRTYGAGDNARDDWHSEGERIGWLDGADLYLEPEAGYAAAQAMARDQGEALAVGGHTLRRRLKERGLLASCERNKTTTRRTLEGRERAVIHLQEAALSAQKQGEQGEQGDNAPKPEENPPVSSPCSNGRAAKQGGETGGNPRRNGHTPPVPPVPPVSGGGGATAFDSLISFIPPVPPVSGVGGAGPAHETAPSPPAGAQLYCQDVHGRPCAPDNAVRWTWKGADRWHDAAEWPPPGRIGPAGSAQAGSNRP